MSPMMDETETEPTLMAIKSACLLFGGSLVTFLAFKQSSPCAFRGITNYEFMNAINSLQESGLGKVRKVQVRCISTPATVFIKEEPGKVNWPTRLCSQTDYRARYNQTANKCVTPAIKRALINAEFIPQDMFPDV